jgi:hypothetical protein
LLDSPQQGAHARHQFEHRERLGEVVVGAQFKPEHAVRLRRAGAEHDHRHIRVPCPQMAADVPTVSARQHQVEQHHVPALAIDRRHRLQTVGLAMQPVAGLLQVQTQGGGDRVVVLDQQQLLVHRASASRRRRWTMQRREATTLDVTPARRRRLTAGRGAGATASRQRTGRRPSTPTSRARERPRS